MLLDPEHAAHIKEGTTQVTGLLLALGELDKRADNTPVPRAVQYVDALIEGYAEAPKFNERQPDSAIS